MPAPLTLRCRPVGRGLWLAWPPDAGAAGGVPPERAEGLLHGEPLTASALGRGPVHEVRLCGLAALPAAGRRRALARVRALAPAAVLRVEWPAAGRAPGVAEARCWQALAPLYVHMLCDRPADLPAVARIAPPLAGVGLPLAAEVLLQRGVNDRVALLRELLPGLLRLGVRPTALVDGAWLPRPRRVGPAAGLALVRGLRGWISGLAAPPLVVEARSGRRRQRVPPYLTRLTVAGAEGRTYRGEPFHYPDPPGTGD